MRPSSPLPDRIFKSQRSSIRSSGQQACLHRRCCNATLQGASIPIQEVRESKKTKTENLQEANPKAALPLLAPRTKLVVETVSVPSYKPSIIPLSNKTMSDQKLRCVVALRLESGNTVCIAKYDHAGQYESHGGAADETTLYGGRDSSYAEAVSKVVENDPPSGLSEAGAIGGFKVVQSDQHQVVYGADSDAICKCNSGFNMVETTLEANW